MRNSSERRAVGPERRMGPSPFSCARLRIRLSDAGWSSPVARWAHNPKVAGSNPAPATKPPKILKVLDDSVRAAGASPQCLQGDETANPEMCGKRHAANMIDLGNPATAESVLNGRRPQPILGEPSLMGLADRILAPCQAMRRIIEGQGCGGDAAQLWSLYERPVKLPIDLRARFRFRIHVPEAARPPRDECGDVSICSPNVPL